FASQRSTVQESPSSPHGAPGGSSRQVAEQQSPSVVLPSSQVSAPRSRPSPQTGVQVEGLPAQVQPSSTAHAEAQPSPSIALPSSQVSAPCIWPSPQT